MNQIEIFNSPEFGSIRTLEQNGKVLFCGTDVATALGYTNPRKAVRDHTRGGTKCSIGVQTGKKADGSPAVQMVEMLFIPEGDLYRLIAHSKLPSAERFEQWVFDEVLPKPLAAVLDPQAVHLHCGVVSADPPHLIAQMGQQFRQIRFLGDLHFCVCKASFDLACHGDDLLSGETQKATQGIRGSDALGGFSLNRVLLFWL